MNSTELTNLAEWKKWGQSVVPEAPLVPGISAKTRNRFKDHLRRRKMPNAVCSQSMTRTTSSFHH